MMTLSEELYEKIEEKTSSLGVPFQEYLRHLILNDVSDESSLSKQDLKDIKQAIEEYKRGEYVTIEPHESVGKKLKSD